MLLLTFDVSDAQVGTVEVFIPFPKPVMILAEINCPKENEVVCKVAPTTIIAEPLVKVSYFGI